MRTAGSHQAPIVEANQSQNHDRKLASAAAGQRTGWQRRELWRKRRAAALAGKLSDELLLPKQRPREQQQSPLQQNKQQTGHQQPAPSISKSNSSSDKASDQEARVGQAIEVPGDFNAPPVRHQQPAISHPLAASNQTAAPLVHTDQFNTTTRLLYVSNPADEHSRRQLTRQNTLAGTFARGRAARLMGVQQQDHMATSASSQDQLMGPTISPRLDIVNLELAPTSATLTWTLSWLTPSGSNARSKRDTIEVRASLANGSSSRAKRRREKSEEAAADEEPTSEMDLEEESLEDIDRSRRRNESRRLQASTKSSTTTSTTSTTEKPEDKFALEVGELQLSKKDNSDQDEMDDDDGRDDNGDIMRRKQHANDPVNAPAPIRNGTLRPLPQLSGPTRRPPNRKHQPPQKQQHEPPHRNMTTTSTSTTTTTTSTTTTSTSKPTTVKHRLVSSTSPRASASSSTAKPKPVVQGQKLNAVVAAPGEPEPPMVRLPAVAINRISSTAKPTAAFLNETTSSHTNAKSRDRTRAKNLRLDEVNISNGTANQQEINTATLANPTPPTNTSLPAQTHPAAPGDREPSESAMKSSVAKTLVGSDAPVIPPATSTTPDRPQLDPVQVATSTTPAPSPTPTAATTSERPIISITRSQLITASQQVANTDARELEQAGPAQAPVRTAKEAPAEPTSSFKSSWLVRLRKFGSNEVDIVKISANLTDLSQQPITRTIAFRMLEPSSGYEICVESASPNQLISDRYQILNANHFLKCHDISDVELSHINSTESEVMRRMDLAPSGQSEAEKSNAPRIKSLCREFLTPSAGSNQTISFNQVQNLKSESLNETVGWPPEASGSSVPESARRPKALGGLGPTSNQLKSRVELMEIGSEHREPAIFEMFSSSSSSRGGRSPLLLSESSANGNNTFLTGPFMGLDTSSLLPIVACVFLLIFLATLANMVLNLLHCADRPGGLRSSTRRLRQRFRSRSGRKWVSSPQVTTGHLQALSPMSSPSRAGYFGSSERSGSSNSRILVVGEKLNEPYGSSSSYFDIPNADHQGHLYGRLSSGTGGLLRVHGETNSPTYGLAPGRPSTPAAASVYALSSAARFPLGPSFEGDEKHNADMVGLARRNYDNFINNIYNADNLASELSNAQLNSGRNGTAASNERDTKRELVIQATTFRHQAEPNEEARRTRTVPAKQRIRFDKVNPIYNMDGIQQFTSELQTAAEGGERHSTLAACPSSPASSSCSASSAGARTATTSVDSSPATVGAKSPHRLSAACSLCDSLPADQQTQLVATTNSALDKQKQRFHARQQQLERVLSKSGSLVPQPFIAPIGEQQTADEVTNSANLKSSFLFGEQQADQEQVTGTFEGELAVGRRVPPTPPSPLSPEESRAPSPQPAAAPAPLASKSLPATNKKPLVQLQETGTIGQQHQTDAQIINKTDFHQRRNELASKLQLAGMTKQQPQQQQ